MKTRDKYIVGALFMALLLTLAVGPTALRAVDSLTWEGVLPSIFTGTSGTEAINVAVTQSTTGLDVTEETATTNALVEVIGRTLTSSGTPASGLGPKDVFAVETTADHIEDVGYVGFSLTDTTLDSEDASFVVGAMAAGAAAANKFSIGSTGIVALYGGATLDNTTSATNLAIAETNIGLTGATTITGALVQTGAVTQDGGVVTINEAGADYDFRVESNDVQDILKVDAGLNVIQHGAWDAYEYATTTAQSYSLASAGKAGIVIQTVGAAGTGHLMTDLLTSPGPGGIVIWKTGDSNDITLDTEGGEKIDGADTYVIDGTLEAVTLMTDGTNWHIIGGYLE